MANFNVFPEDINGQYRLFSLDEHIPENDFQELINYSKKGLKLFETIKKKMLEKKEAITLEEVSRYQKNLEDFIIGYFRLYDCFDLEKVLNDYENNSNDYHAMGRLFLFYLHTFIYKKSIIHQLNESLFIRMENFVLEDFVPYRREEDKIVLEEIENRKKLRVENYDVYSSEKLGELLEKMLRSKAEENENTELSNTTYGEVKNAIVCFLEDKKYQLAVFEQYALSNHPKEKNGLVSMLFLDYLDLYGYQEAAHSQSKRLKKQIEEMENLVVLCFSDSYKLSRHQEAIYERIKENVSIRTQKYVLEEAPKLFSMLKDYKALEEFKSSGKRRLIHEQFNFKELPKVYSKEEVKKRLEIFLQSVLYLTRGFEKENIPLFVSGLEEERNSVFTLALSYLTLFVYSVSFDYGFQDSFIKRLEHYIVSCEDFKVEESSLCQAKSILYKREGLRSLSDEKQAINILKRMKF